MKKAEKSFLPNTAVEMKIIQREVIGIIFTIFCFLGIISLFSHNNALGLVAIKNIYQTLFGHYGTIIPILLVGWVGISYLKDPGQKKISTCRVNFGLLLLAFEYLLLLNLIIKEDSFNYYLNGGLIGHTLYKILLANFSLVGTWIVWGIVFVIGLFFITNKPLRYYFLLLQNKLNAIQLQKTQMTNIKTKEEEKELEIPVSKPQTDLLGRKRYAKIDLSRDYFSEEPEDEVKPALLKPQIMPNTQNKQEIFTKQIPLDFPYKLPPVNLLPNDMETKKKTKPNIHQSSNLLSTLQTYGIQAKIVDVHYGPVITRYDLQPAPGIKVSRIVNLADDLALALAAKGLRIEAPIPGKAAVGIEVPNNTSELVTFRELLNSYHFQKFQGKLPLTLGKDIAGGIIITDLTKAPHLLIAGATGTGKSVCINTIICGLLYKCTPNDTRFILIDPKMVELSVYDQIPHLLTPVVKEAKKAALALKWAVKHMEERYRILADTGTKHIERYNMTVDPKDKFHYIVIIIDELADLMMVAANEVEDSICRLAQMARAVGIHLIVATQRPSVDVITGLIKANIPSRIAFAVSSQIDSRTILDCTGAEKLLGRGDMLFSPTGALKPLRLQGALITDNQIELIVKYWANQQKPQYVDLNLENPRGKHEEEPDDLFFDALRIIADYGQASASLLQRRLHIGYTRAARLIDQLEAKGVISGYEGSKPRDILKSPAQLQSMIERRHFD